MKADSLGAGEILLTSMDCDGTKAGYDNELTSLIAENVSVPVIASGGAGTKEHFYDALTKGKADAALAASLFHYKELEIRDLKAVSAGAGHFRAAVIQGLCMVRRFRCFRQYRSASERSTGNERSDSYGSHCK